MPSRWATAAVTTMPRKVITKPTGRYSAGEKERKDGRIRWAPEQHSEIISVAVSPEALWMREAVDNVVTVRMTSTVFDRMSMITTTEDRTVGRSEFNSHANFTLNEIRASYAF